MKLSWFTFAVVLFVTSQTFAQAPAGYKKIEFESENPPTIIYDDQAHLSGRYKNQYGNWVFHNIAVFDPEVPKFVATDDAYITGDSA